MLVQAHIHINKSLLNQQMFFFFGCSSLAWHGKLYYLFLNASKSSTHMLDGSTGVVIIPPDTSRQVLYRIRVSN